MKILNSILSCPGTRFDQVLSPMLQIFHMVHKIDVFTVVTDDLAYHTPLSQGLDHKTLHG
jgi:hypothetical protein